MKKQNNSLKKCTAIKMEHIHYENNNPIEIFPNYYLKEIIISKK